MARSEMGSKLKAKQMIKTCCSSPVLNGMNAWTKIHIYNDCESRSIDVILKQLKIWVE